MPSEPNQIQDGLNYIYGYKLSIDDFFRTFGSTFQQWVKTEYKDMKPYTGQLTHRHPDRFDEETVVKFAKCLNMRSVLMINEAILEFRVPDNLLHPIWNMAAQAQVPFCFLYGVVLPRDGGIVISCADLHKLAKTLPAIPNPVEGSSAQPDVHIMEFP